MEDSFSVRVDKVFGALSTPPSSSIPGSNLRSLWSLTDDEIEKREWNRDKDNSPEPEPRSISSSFTAYSNKQSEGSSSSRTFDDEFEKDIEDLDDVGNDDDDDAGFAQRSSKPDDFDDEQWEIKSNIGRDCTLDYEEEEDAYDKQAIGKEKSGDRVFMKDITDDGINIDTDNVLPTSFRDFVRDPRANHSAAKIRLKEDAEAAKKMNALHVSEKAEGENDEVKPKSILKRKDDQSDSKLQKRVRFEPDCNDKGNDQDDGNRESFMETSSSMEDQVVVSDGKPSPPPRSQRFESAVPDYLRNPSRYTRYSLDSESDVDEEANKRAYMDFLKLINRSNASAETEEEDLPSVTFISRKKRSGDEAMAGTTASSHPNKEVLVNKNISPVGVAVANDEDEDVSAMEEDEPEAAENDGRRNTSVKFNRQYRKKAKEEQD